MLLILTNRGDATANYLMPLLRESLVPFLRFDTDCLTSMMSLSYRLGEPSVSIDGKWYTANDVDSVWFRRPERLSDPRFGNSPEGKYALDEWAEGLEGFLAHIPTAKWMNHPAVNAAASHKIEQLSTARNLGLRVPDTLVTQHPEALRDFYYLHNERVVVKPMAGGYIERSSKQGDSLIYTNEVRPVDLANLDDLTACPTLFQELIDKSHEVRITVVDDDIHAVELCAKESDGSQRCDIRRNNMSGVLYRMANLPSGVDSGIRKLMRHYRLRFAAIDMVVSRDGTWYFLEINPNGQWAWLDLSAATAIWRSFVGSFRRTPT